MNTTNHNQLAPVVEQQVLDREANQIQDILNRFKQPIPEGFIQIETDYICTTKAKWDKPLSERYGFSYQGEWRHIDIPHYLLEKLELEQGKEIVHPIYLDPRILQRKPFCGGITIEDESEIFLDKHLTINSLEKSLKELVNKISHLEDQIK